MRLEQAIRRFSFLLSKIEPVVAKPDDDPAENLPVGGRGGALAGFDYFRQLQTCDLRSELGQEIDVPILGDHDSESGRGRGLHITDGRVVTRLSRIRGSSP